MKVVTAHLESLSPYGQSKVVTEPKLKNKSGNDAENHEDYEKRTWRERCHYDQHGNVFIPPMVFKNCLSDAAKFLSVKKPGEGKATYTKHFEAGIMVTDPMPLGVTKETIPGLWLFVPADGVRGGAKRVNKCFPVVPSWKGEVTFYILDDSIPQDIFERHLIDAGNFIGIGFFRPRRNGYFGRFRVSKFVWKTLE